MKSFVTKLQIAMYEILWCQRDPTKPVIAIRILPNLQAQNVSLLATLKLARY
jgi:hypothetical protein